MAKGTRKAKKATGAKVGNAIPKNVIKRFSTLMKDATAFGKLIGAT